MKNCLFAVPLPTHFYPPLPKTFFGTSGKYIYIFFLSENQDFPITQQCKKKEYAKTIFFLPTYPTKKYRVGVQQTNNFFKNGQMVIFNIIEIILLFFAKYQLAIS